MYAYCNNNSILSSDNDGHGIGLFVAGAVLAGLGGLFVYNLNKQQKKASKIRKNIQKKKKKVPDKTYQIETMTKQNTAKILDATRGQNTVQKMKTFASAVKTGGIYDLKSQPEWKNQTVLFNGVVMESQDIGNYHYGYMGRALGFDTDFLLLAGGLVQLKDHYDKVDTYLNCAAMTFCDDPRDSYYIKMGAYAYDQEH